MEALHEAGHDTPLDHVEQIVVVIVKSMSTPKTDWNKSEDPPGTLSILVKAAGVPIDRYSNEQIQQLRDIESRWDAMRSLRDLPAIKKIPAKDSNAALNAIRKVPNAKIYVVNVSFDGVPDAGALAAAHGLGGLLVHGHDLVRVTDLAPVRGQAAAGQFGGNPRLVAVQQVLLEVQTAQRRACAHA
jgi:hypothetical protein